MIIEVTGTATRNKGAELMLAAVAQHLREHRSVAGVAVEPSFGSYPERARHGVWTKLPPYRLGRSSTAVRLMPASFRRMAGLVLECEITAVLDAAGFAFSDQLPLRRTEQFATDVERWKSQGKKVVLLPQALGPFRTPAHREAFLRVVLAADLVFARDSESLDHVREIAPKADNLDLAPDFTNLVKPVLPEGFDARPGRACIVPNHRMVELTTADVKQRYLPFLAACIAKLEALGLEPFILLHDTHIDQTLVEPLEACVGRSLEVVREEDPRRLKGILGGAEVVVGSRFHALVGALAQAVPTFATGWSHKYERLFEDYGCPECLLSTSMSPADLRERLRDALSTHGRARMVQTLRERGAAQVKLVERMWRRVDEVLGLPSVERRPVAAGVGVAA